MPRKIGQAVTLSEAYNRPFPTRFRILVDRAKARDGKSQQKIAEELGFSNRQTIGYYYNGSQSPSLETLAKIAEYFNVTSDYLLGLTDAPSTELDLANAEKLTGLSTNSLLNLKYFTQNGDEAVKNIIDRFIGSYECLQMINNALNVYDASKEIRELKPEDMEFKETHWAEYLERVDKAEQKQDAMKLYEYKAITNLQGFLKHICENGIEPCNDPKSENADIEWYAEFNIPEMGRDELDEFYNQSADFPDQGEEEEQ